MHTVFKDYSNSKAPIEEETPPFFRQKSKGCFKVSQDALTHPESYATLPLRLKVKRKKKLKY